MSVYPSLNIPDFFALWLIVVAVWLIEGRLPISPSASPVALFRFVCERMANKVLPLKHQGQQHYISGTLAIIVLLVPLLIIIYLIIEFASYAWLLDAFILYLAMQFSADAKVTAQVHYALNADKNQLAKDLLQANVKRETQQLSSIGLNKANIESYMLRFLHQKVSVAFCFVLLGPLAALAYRLCVEASQSWNINIPSFKRFGKASSVICALVQFVPERLYILILLVMSFSKEMMNGLSAFLKPQYLFQLGRTAVLLGLSFAISRKMGGAILYTDTKQSNRRTENEKSASPHMGIKHRRPSFGQTHEPELGQLKALKNLNQSVSFVFMIVLLVLAYIRY